MNIIAWNVNGIKSLMKDNYLQEFFKVENPDILCLGEIKISIPYNKLEIEFNKINSNYTYQYWHPCRAKNGYSGSVIFSKIKPINVIYGLLNGDGINIDMEGRVICVEYDKFFLLHSYTPNSGEELKRLDYRVKTWDIAFTNYIIYLETLKPTIVCGDLNVAHHEIDLKNPKSNHKTAGFTNEERESFSSLLQYTDMVDTFRTLYPKEILYTYWSYRFNSRAKNSGWRIDYFLINKKNIKNILNSSILTNILGSDHCPVKLIINI